LATDLTREKAWGYQFFCLI